MTQPTPRIPEDLSGHPVAVYGLGRSGASAARWLLRLGARPTLFDDRPLPPERLAAQGLGQLAPPVPPVSFEGFSLVVVAPGIPLAAAGRQLARSQGVPVVGELGLAARDLEATLTVVTGSHGKSTVTAWTALLLEAGGQPAVACGNLGRPLAEVRLEGEVPAEVVAECSSFQLHDSPELVADRAVFTAYAPNHLDWHPDEAHYRESKLALLERMRPGSRVACLPGFPGLDERLEGRELETVEVSERGPYGHDEGAVGRVRTPAGAVELTGIEGAPAGEGLALLAPLVALAAAATGAGPDEVRAAALRFEPFPHRMEDLGEVGGRRFFNDSKATTPAASAYSLARLDPSPARPVVLILGGKDKGLAFAPYRKVLARALELVVTGAAAGRILGDLEGLPLVEEPDFEAAVHRAAADCPEGGTVLLAPGCSSYDAFSNYEERGECFRQSVRSWRRA